MQIFDYEYAYPWLLLLLIIIPFIAAWFFWFGKKRHQSITFSNTDIIRKRRRSWREHLVHFPVILRLLAVGALIFALARPQSFSSGEDISTQGIDIVLVMDVSSSMLAEDFTPNRIEAARNITDDFIEGRTSDRIGLVIFSRYAYTQCPLTMDYVFLRNLLAEVKSGMIEDGTAIGNAIGNAVNRLKDSDAKSKVMILLTDGVNNSGEVDPITAARIADEYGISIYTVGVGTRGEAPYPFQTPFGIQYQRVPVEIDEETLQEVSSITEGKYFRATNNKKLELIYEEIDKLEKTKVTVTSYRNTAEHFFPFILWGLIFILAEVILNKTIFRKLP